MGNYLVIKQKYDEMMIEKKKQQKRHGNQVVPIHEHYEPLMSAQEEAPVLDTNESSFASHEDELVQNQLEPKLRAGEEDSSFSEKEQELIRIFKEHTHVLSLKECVSFYQSFVASIEISRNNELSKVFYPIPTETKFVT